MTDVVQPQKITIRFGNMTYPNWSCRVLAFGMTPEGTIPLREVALATGRMPPILSNNANNRNGEWHGNWYEIAEGTVMIMKSIQKFGPSVIRYSIMPLRMSAAGPTLMVKGVFPTVRGFHHQDDLMLFSGTGHILNFDDLEILGLADGLSDYDVAQGFDDEMFGECFSVQVIRDGEPKPKFKAIKRGGVVVGGVAIPTPPARKVRVRVANQEEPNNRSPRARRRRR